MAHMHLFSYNTPYFNSPLFLVKWVKSGFVNWDISHLTKLLGSHFTKIVVFWLHSENNTTRSLENQKTGLIGEF